MTHGKKLAIQIGDAIVGRDPFTSDNARVREVTGLQAVKLIAEVTEFYGAVLRVTYGPRARIRYLKYFGQPGEWQAGYDIGYGFKIITRNQYKPEVAVADALALHTVDDPCPARPLGRPGGYFLKGGEGYVGK